MSHCPFKHAEKLLMSLRNRHLVALIRLSEAYDADPSAFIPRTEFGRDVIYGIQRFLVTSGMASIIEVHREFGYRLKRPLSDIGITAHDVALVRGKRKDNRWSPEHRALLSEARKAKTPKSRGPDGLTDFQRKKLMPVYGDSAPTVKPRIIRVTATPSVQARLLGDATASHLGVHLEDQSATFIGMDTVTVLADDRRIGSVSFPEDAVRGPEWIWQQAYQLSISARLPNEFTSQKNFGPTAESHGRNPREVIGHISARRTAHRSRASSRQVTGTSERASNEATLETGTNSTDAPQRTVVIEDKHQ